MEAEEEEKMTQSQIATGLFWRRIQPTQNGVSHTHCRFRAYIPGSAGRGAGRWPTGSSRGLRLGVVEVARRREGAERCRKDKQRFRDTFSTAAEGGEGEEVKRKDDGITRRFVWTGRRSGEAVARVKPS